VAAERDRYEERDREEEELQDHRPWEALPHEVAQLAGDLADQLEAGQRREGKKERPRVLLEQIPGQNAH
jgi:hypothetical protein